jgi:geranylgeranylglycerol-phosphate geranylgeranyltransferase
LAVGALVLASCLLAGGSSALSAASGLAVLGSMLAAAGGYVFNDVCDYATDRVVHVRRVLPSNELPRTTAAVYGLLLLTCSPLCFLGVNRPSLAAAVVAVLLLVLYSWWLKRASGILGNVVVALLAANAALLGGLVTGHVAAVVPLLVCVALATLAREIVKDIEDLPGDAGVRSRTVPMLLGPRGASRLAALALLLSVPAAYLPAAYLPALRGQGGVPYLIAATLLNGGVLYVVWRLLRWPADEVSRMQRLIRTLMYLYIAIFLLAGWFGPRLAA